MRVEELARALENSGRRFREELRRELVTLGLEAEGEARALIESRMRVRTGRLRQSPVSLVGAIPEGLELAVRAGGSVGRKPLEYAALQEHGGTITPTRGKFLAIPVGAALTGAGVARRPSARDWLDLRFVPTRGGAQGVLVRQVGGKNARSEIMYVLVRRVTIRAKYFMRDAAIPAFNQIPARVGSRLGAHLLGGARG